MKELKKLLKEGKFSYEVEISKGMVLGLIGLEAKSLIEGLMKFNPEKRFTLQQVLAHPWLHLDREHINSIRKNVNEQDLHLNEKSVNRGILKKLEELGYEQQVVMKSLSRGELNGASTTYKLLMK
jgi:serine/threonine protein kinase